MQCAYLLLRNSALPSSSGAGSEALIVPAGNIGAMQLPVPDLRRPLQRNAVMRSSQAYTLSLLIPPDT